MAPEDKRRQKQAKPKVVSFQDPQQTPKTTEHSLRDRHYQVALHHARRLQERKDLEAEIFCSLEELIDFPTAESASVASPSLEDLARFRALIKPFQVSDYDALMDERQTADKCAYVFCPLPLRKDTSRGKGLRVVWGRGDLKVVPSQKYETWCSKACAKRAMFIKVQLSETPAWERKAESSDSHIELLDETSDSLQAQTARLRSNGGDTHDLENARGQLAMERGESVTSSRPAVVMSSFLKERVHVSAPRPPSAEGQESGAIEGYLPRTALSKQSLRNDTLDEDHEEDRDRDWILA